MRAAITAAKKTEDEPPRRVTWLADDLTADIYGAEPNWPKYFLLGHAVELALKAVPEHFKQSPHYKLPSGQS
jgi:hypothetical protein